jgi:hypothetical protein
VPEVDRDKSYLYFLIILNLEYGLTFIHPRLSCFPLPAYRRQAKGDKNIMS